MRFIITADSGRSSTHEVSRLNEIRVGHPFPGWKRAKRFIQTNEMEFAFASMTTGDGLHRLFGVN
jgi:hypothetical protein